MAERQREETGIALIQRVKVFGSGEYDRWSTYNCHINTNLWTLKYFYSIHRN